MRGIGPFLKDAWQLARPYFMTSEERWSARGILAAVVAMNLALVFLDVVLSYWRREFYNTLQDRDLSAFLDLVLWYRATPDGIMPGFCAIAATFVGIAVYSVYLNQLLQIRWRRWMTRAFLAAQMVSLLYQWNALVEKAAARIAEGGAQDISAVVQALSGNIAALKSATEETERGVAKIHP